VSVSGGGGARGVGGGELASDVDADAARSGDGGSGSAAGSPGSGTGGGAASPPMPRVVYEKMPSDIADRYVLLLDPILATGVSSMAAIDRLQRRGVRQDRIMFVTVIAASQGIHQLAMRYPQMKIITSEVDAGLNENNRVVPGVGEFGDRYFGTEEMRARFDLDEDEEIGFE
jgi:hypothetical protein